MASWPASTYARYGATAQDLLDEITNGEFALCRVAMGLPQGPPPLPSPTPPPPSPPPPPPPLQ
eukprot:38992-Prymnesium_polylepis.1